MKAPEQRITYLMACLNDISMLARRGLAYGWASAKTDAERVTYRDKRLQHIVEICARAGVESSILRDDLVIEELVTCPDCEGKGEVLDAPCNALDGPAYWTTCETCHGSRTVNREE
jgi:hypothetical protein